MLLPMYTTLAKSEPLLYCNCVKTNQARMARRRAILTDTERELLDTNENSDRYYQAVSRIRRKINQELTEDIQLLRKNNPELFEELQEVVCD